MMDFDDDEMISRAVPERGEEEDSRGDRLLYEHHFQYGVFKSNAKQHTGPSMISRMRYIFVGFPPFFQCKVLCCICTAVIYYSIQRSMYKQAIYLGIRRLNSASECCIFSLLSYSCFLSSEMVDCVWKAETIVTISSSFKTPRRGLPAFAFVASSIPYFHSIPGSGIDLLGVIFDAFVPDLLTSRALLLLSLSGAYF